MSEENNQNYARANRNHNYKDYSDIQTHNDDPEIANYYTEVTELKKAMHAHGFGKKLQDMFNMKHSMKVGQTITFYCDGFFDDVKCQKRIRGINK